MACMRVLLTSYILYSPLPPAKRFLQPGLNERSLVDVSWCDLTRREVKWRACCRLVHSSVTVSFSSLACGQANLPNDVMNESLIDFYPPLYLCSALIAPLPRRTFSPTGIFLAPLPRRTFSPTGIFLSFLISWRTVCGHTLRQLVIQIRSGWLLRSSIFILRGRCILRRNVFPVPFFNAVPSYCPSTTLLFVFFFLLSWNASRN